MIQSFHRNTILGTTTKWFHPLILLMKPDYAAFVSSNQLNNNELHSQHAHQLPEHSQTAFNIRTIFYTRTTHNPMDTIFIKQLKGKKHKKSKPIIHTCMTLPQESTHTCTHSKHRHKHETKTGY